MSYRLGSTTTYSIGQPIRRIYSRIYVHSPAGARLQGARSARAGARTRAEATAVHQRKQTPHHAPPRLPPAALTAAHPVRIGHPLAAAAAGTRSRRRHRSSWTRRRWWARRTLAVRALAASAGHETRTTRFDERTSRHTRCVKLHALGGSETREGWAAAAAHSCRERRRSR